MEYKIQSLWILTLWTLEIKRSTTVFTETLVIELSYNSGDKTQTEEVKFYDVDIESSYYAILGTPFHVSFDFVVSISHQKVKILTKNEVVSVQSSQKNLFDFLMTIRKKQLENDQILVPMEIGAIQMVQVIGEKEPQDEEIHNEIQNQVF